MELAVPRGRQEATAALFYFHFTSFPASPSEQTPRACVHPPPPRAVCTLQGLCCCTLDCPGAECLLKVHKAFTLFFCFHIHSEEHLSSLQSLRLKCEGSPGECADLDILLRLNHPMGESGMFLDIKKILFYPPAEFRFLPHRSYRLLDLV